jgi:hypothetical protein
MRMDTRNRRGSAALRRVPEEESAALQDISRRGPTTQQARQSVCGRSSPSTSKRVLFPGNTIDYTMHNQRLFISLPHCNKSILPFT